MKSHDKKIRVLLIDDDTEQHLILEEILLGTSHELHFTLETASTLEAGLRQISANNVDVVLLDLHLPDSKGIETFLKVNRTSSEIPIIIMSVLYDDSLALEAVRRGAQDYLFKKEIHSDVLVRTIRFAVERHVLRLELAKANHQLEKLALMDPVTELFNRRGLQEILSHELQRVHRKHAELPVLLIDLDDFRKINNALGHGAGDVVLKEVAQKLKNSLRATDYLGRVGGDEFMVLLPDTRFAEGMHIAEKIRMSISTTMVSMSSLRNVKVTASLALINAGMMDLGTSDPLSDMISNIHLILHQQKKSHKNQVIHDEPEFAYDTPYDISQQLMGEDKFYAMVQPIFNLNDGKESAHEFLSRSLVKGFEMPDDFFRAALESNILSRVDFECLKSCVTTSAVLPPGFLCHINLFPSTLINLPPQDFIELFDGIGKQKLYCIEISEQQIIGDPSYLVEPVSQLRKAGALIAIDDLGFGKSCLESLILLEPDIVKIDKKCVTRASENPSLIRSLKRLVKMARSLEAEVIAEGIETEKDLILLQDLGVKFGQGYFLSKPKALALPI